MTSARTDADIVVDSGTLEHILGDRPYVMHTQHVDPITIKLVNETSFRATQRSKIELKT